MTRNEAYRRAARARFGIPLGGPFGPGPRSGPGGFLCGAPAARLAFGADCFHCRVVQGSMAATARGSAGLPRQGGGRGRTASLALQSAEGRAGTGWRGAPAPRASLGQIALRLLADLCGRASAFGRAELYPRPAGLGKADGDGLLRRARAVLAFTDVVYFFADEFAGLRRGRFSLLLVAFGAFARFFFRHGAPNRVDVAGT